MNAGTIFHTTRSDAGYNCSIFINEDGKLVIGLSVRSEGHAIILTDAEAAAFWAAMADRTGSALPLHRPDDGIPPHEPSTCGDAYLAAERTLRVIEHATRLGESMSADAIEQITDLAHEAGAACNRLALKRDVFADDLPF